MKYELFLCLKYLKSKKRQKFISFISVMSVLGVAVGVAALIVVLSVMNGFDHELVDRFVGMDAHLSVEKSGGIPQYRELMDRIEQMDEVVAVAPQLVGQVMLRSSDAARGVVVKGVDFEQEFKASKIDEYLHFPMKASYMETRPSLLIGEELARHMGVVQGDTIDVISPVNVMSKKLKRPILKTYYIAGIFNSKMYDFDATFVYMSLDEFRTLFKMQHLGVGRLNIALKDSSINVMKIRSILAKDLGSEYDVKTWFDRNRNLFAALKLEKTVMFIILTLIILVSAFNIASTLVMVVMEKTKEIGILKALGATRQSIMLLFSLEGLFIGCLGVISGAVLGLGLCQLLEKFDFIRLPGDIYYVTRLPVHVNVTDIYMIVSSALILSFLSALYPAWYASRLNPVEALRSE